MDERLLWPLTVLAAILTTVAIGGCTHSAPTACEDGDVAYAFSSSGRTNYVFAHNVVPYEGFTDLSPFVPTRQEISVADSVLAMRESWKDPVFAQYGGFLSPGGDRVVVANYVYRESREYPDARCSWFFGLGPYFEQNTWEGYVNLARRAPYVIHGPQ